MRAAVMRRGRLVVDTVPDPEPGPGEVLVKTLACGICGSDLHALTARRQDGRGGARGRACPFTLDPARDVVMGHEFCAEVIDFGPDDAARARAGRRASCSMPLAFGARGIHGVGYSNDYPGGYGELMVLVGAAPPAGAERPRRPSTPR